MEKHLIGDIFELLVDIPLGKSKYGYFDDSYKTGDIFTVIKNDEQSKYIDFYKNKNPEDIHFMSKELIDNKQIFKKIFTSKYIHLKTNNEYKVIKYIKIKSPETGDWVDGVLYQSLKTGEEFARSKESFDSHFKNCN